VGKNQDINQEQFQRAVSALPNTKALQVQNKLNEYFSFPAVFIKWQNAKVSHSV
jgi:hypothetical protein